MAVTKVSFNRNLSCSLEFQRLLKYGDGVTMLFRGVKANRTFVKHRRSKSHPVIGYILLMVSNTTPRYSALPAQGMVRS